MSPLQSVANVPAKKRKRRRENRKRSSAKKSNLSARRQTGETAVADALTVGWLLALLFLLACELGSLGAWWFRTRGPGVQLAAEYLLVASLILAVFSLGLLAGALRMRRVAPPGSLVVATWTLSLVPWGIYLSLWWRR